MTLRRFFTGMLVTIVLLPGILLARQPSYYQHLTDVETNYRQGWSMGLWVFWPTDTMTGPVRSNNSILIKYRPTFLDHVTTSASAFVLVSGGPGPHLTYEPFFNAPVYQIPHDLPYLRERATETYTSDNYRLMTTVIFDDARGASVYQRRLGIIDEDSLIATIRPDVPHIIWVEGPVDVKGIVNGRYTIFAEGPIGLIDDLLYSGANIRNADFDERRVTSMIGLVTLDSIIVRNTIANGRNYNDDEERNDFTKHSIMIDGVLIALGGSFTIAEADRRPDYYNDYGSRGNVYTRGSVVQRTRGALGLSGFGGRTGYWWHKAYDNRLRNNGPPGLGPTDYPIIQQDNERLDLENYPFDVYTSQMPSLFMEDGGRLVIQPDAQIEVRDTLILRGTEEHPLEVTALNGSSRISIVSRDGCVVLENVHISANVSLQMEGGTCRVVNSVLESPISVAGELAIISSHIGGFLRVTSGLAVRCDYVDFNDGLFISALRDEVIIRNCTIAGSNAAGLRLRGNCTAEVTNSIFAYNGQGIVVEGNAGVELTYSDVFGNDRDDLVGVAFGEGCISLDPQFESLETGNYRLTAGSPCIDAGDPASPRDPDGTVADIGAFWLDRGLGNGDDDDDAGRRGRLPAEISASPNPFNATTVIRYLSDGQGRPSSLRIYDLAGREVYSQGKITPPTPPAIAGGEITLTWDAIAYPAGIYIVRVGSGKEAKSMKIVKVN